MGRNRKAAGNEVAVSRVEGKAFIQSKTSPGPCQGHVELEENLHSGERSDFAVKFDGHWSSRF